MNVDERNEKELREQIEYLQGQLDCLTFIVAGLMLPSFGVEKAKEIASRNMPIPDNAAKHGTSKEKGHLDMFQKIEKELENFL